MWCTSLRNAIYAAILLEFLRNGTLLTLNQVSDTLGSKHVVNAFTTFRLLMIVIFSQERMERSLCDSR